MHEYSLSITDYNHYFFTEFFNSDITSYAKLLIYEEEEWILSEGEPLDRLYFLKQGKVKLYKDLNVRPRLVKLLGSPALLGEVELFNQQPSMVGIQALDDCACYVVDLKLCKDKLLNDPVFMKKICLSFGNKLETKFDRQLNNHRIGLSCRLARFIHFTKNKLYFKESSFEVAEYLGVVEAEILKVLNEFEKKGMISRCDQGYHIINEGLLLDYTELE